jgi:GntR family transcriptional regulator
MLADSLHRDIVDGRFPVGSILPTENDLCRLYGVSRYTVREAMRRLSELGLIERQKGVGTHVIAAEGQARYTHNIESLDELHQYGSDTLLKVTHSEEIETDAALAGFLGCQTGRKWLRFEGLRLLPERTLPVAWVEIYVPGIFSAIRARIEQGNVAIYKLIEETYGMSTVEVIQETRAISLGPDLATALHSAQGTPALDVVRRYHDARGEQFEIAHSVMPADRHSFKIRIRRRAG